MNKLVRGINDLETINPELAKQWHPTKNNNLTPRDVLAGSNKNVWWKGTCGHEWKAVIDSRNCGRGCPYCSNKKVLLGFNDLITKNPKLLAEWDYDKNYPLKPEYFVPGSHKYAWWKCSKCGYEWRAEIRMRAQYGQGCRKCAKEKMGNTYRKTLLSSGKKPLSVEYPELAQEWHPVKNHPKSASDYTSSSHEKVWWKCSACGYEWPATIHNRVDRKSGCPLCAGSIIVAGVNDLKTFNPALADEWHPTKNLPLEANAVGPYSSKNVWWVCKFGHEYRCRVIDRQKGVGCSECSKRFRTSLPEKIIEYYVKQEFSDVIGNYRPDFLLGSEIDIYIPQIMCGIEYDGQRYHKDIERDRKKDGICIEHGIRLIRIRERKCPVYDREGPTIILNSQTDDEFSKAIIILFEILGITRETIDIHRDRQFIMESYRNTVINGSIAEEYPQLAEEWHPKWNGLLKPENIPATKSKDTYYWKCSKCGYSWKAVLYERISGTGCPACAGKMVMSGYNDLATTHPELAKEWHPTKNGDLTPQKVSKGQDTIIWWKCSKCGYEWSSKIKKRVAGSGCEKCAIAKWGKKQCKKVYQFTKKGQLVNEYPNAKTAAKELGISKSSIQHVCTGIGGMKSAGGFFWSYYRDGRTNVDSSDHIISRTGTPVLQYNSKNVFIREFESAKAAAATLGISEASIRHACRGTGGRKTAAGFVWKYKS